MSLLDPAVIVLWLVGLTAWSLMISRKGRSGTDLIAGHHDLPAWAICLSIVATETSTLTVISVPGIAYRRGMVFVGLGLGYLIGRILVARYLLPLYMRGNLTTAYQYLGERFGRPMQRLAACSFLGTRLLAEGVRLFASTIPICALLAARGMALSPVEVLIGLTALTALYTAAGGLRAVVWADAAQFLLYAFGAVICAVLLWSGLSGDQLAGIGSRFSPFEFAAPMFTSAYAPITALFGGAVMAMASHGVDQLMVQRVLAARSLRDAQRAMIGSAVVVTLLFALLSLSGIFLWVREGGASLAAMGLHSPDEIFPRFVVNDLPPGLSGLLVAGIISATMGSLASALNAMTGSTVADLLGRRAEGVWASRLITALWAVLLIATAGAFSVSSQSALIFGLQVAGYCYGALLGAFLFGLLVPRARARDAMLAFVVTVGVVALVIAKLRIGGAALAFPWLTPLGVVVTFLAGLPAILRKRGA